jgi:hypothetical protein
LDVATGSIDQSGSYVFAVAAVAATTSVGELLPAWSLQGGNDSMFTFWNSGGQQQDVVLMLSPADGSSPYELPIHLMPGSSVNLDLAEIKSSGKPDPQGHSFPLALFGSAMLMPAGIPKPGPNGLINVPASGFWNMKDVILSAAVFNPSTGTCGNYCGDCCGYSCPEVIADSQYVAVGSTFSAYMTVEDVSGYSENCTSTADWGANLFTYNGIVADEAQFTVTGSGTGYVQGDLWDAAVPPVDNYCPCGCPTDDIFANSPNITSSPADQCGDPTSPTSLSRGALISEYAAYGVDLTPSCSDFNESAGSAYFSHSELTVNDESVWSLIREPLTVGSGAGYGLDAWRVDYGSARTTNSVYRTPAHNSQVGGAAQSRHMYGDAADLNNQSGLLSEWQAMIAAAGQGAGEAQADFEEPQSGPCGIACAHADWRSHAGGYSH